MNAITNSSHRVRTMPTAVAAALLSSVPTSLGAVRCYVGYHLVYHRRRRRPALRWVDVSTHHQAADALRLDGKRPDRGTTVDRTESRQS